MQPDHHHGRRSGLGDDPAPEGPDAGVGVRCERGWGGACAGRGRGDIGGRGENQSLALGAWRCGGEADAEAEERLLSGGRMRACGRRALLCAVAAFLAWSIPVRPSSARLPPLRPALVPATAAVIVALALGILSSSCSSSATATTVRVYGVYWGSLACCARILLYGFVSQARPPHHTPPYVHRSTITDPADLSRCRSRFNLARPIEMRKISFLVVRS